MAKPDCVASRPLELVCQRELEVGKVGQDRKREQEREEEEIQERPSRTYQEVLVGSQKTRIPYKSRPKRQLMRFQWEQDLVNNLYTLW